MKVKKLISVLLAAGMIATVAAGCGGSGGEGGSGGAKTLRIGDNWGSSHPMAAALDNVFKTQIEEQTNGELTVEVYHDGLRGDKTNLWQSVRDGAVDFVVVGTATWSTPRMCGPARWPTR